MEKVDLTKQFSYRLREAMLNAGFNSTRSVSGVSIHKLTEITGYSLQICRKYLRGEAIPEPLKVVEIAHALQVSPGWLLFGNRCVNQKVAQSITISKNLLHYIFISANCLYNPTQNKEYPNFLVELIEDISKIHTDEEQSKKIIDLALQSIQRFNGN